MSNFRYDSAFYVQALDRYVATGECSATDTEPLYGYLLSVMNDPMVKLQVLNDPICARVFYDTMISFVSLNLEKEKYNMQRSQSEQEGMRLALEWSLDKRKDGWQALVKQIGDKYEGVGFDRAFYWGQLGNEGRYADDGLWERMIEDWREALRQEQQEQKVKEVETRKDDFDRRLRSNLKNVPEYLRSHQVEKDEFYQAWGLMSGIWNTVDFERFRKIVRIQREYPDIVKVANRMGRIADDEGKEQVSVSGGDVYRLEHSSRSDILGVTTGNNLNALLPVELAHYVDDELEDVFVYKFLTRNLQSFRYKSEIMQPARRLEKKPATSKGPMIVCLDTSGSMVGKPEKIAHSLLVKLLEIADRQRRACFLIAFSVSVNPIDVRKDRARLLDFFSHTATGDTNATRMLKTTFGLLQSKKEYMNADVLWISDFKIPLVTPELISRMQEYRRADTHFYGFQLGTADNDWKALFDHVYRVDYTPSRRY